jgi:hypothetical protein
MTFRQKSVRQMRPQKTGATGDDGNGLRTRRHAALYLAVGAGICQQEVEEMTKPRKYGLAPRVLRRLIRGEAPAFAKATARQANDE